MDCIAPALQRRNSSNKARGTFKTSVPVGRVEGTCHEGAMRTRKRARWAACAMPRQRARSRGHAARVPQRVRRPSVQSRRGSHRMKGVVEWQALGCLRLVVLWEVRSRSRFPGPSQSPVQRGRQRCHAHGIEKDRYPAEIASRR